MRRPYLHNGESGLEQFSLAFIRLNGRAGLLAIVMLLLNFLL
jgi:hypothetical protein